MCNDYDTKYVHFHQQKTNASSGNFFNFGAGNLEKPSKLKFTKDLTNISKLRGFYNIDNNDTLRRTTTCIYKMDGEGEVI